MSINLVQLSHANHVAQEYKETYFESSQEEHSDTDVDMGQIDKLLEFLERVRDWCLDEKYLFKIGPYALTPATIFGLLTGMAPVIAILYTTIQNRNDAGEAQ